MFPTSLCQEDAHSVHMLVISKLELQLQETWGFYNCLSASRQISHPPHQKLASLLRVCFEFPHAKPRVGVWICNEHIVQDENKFRGRAK